MILIIAFIGLLIYLFAEIFHYQKVKANAFSKKEMAKAADAQASKLSYIDPVISCDYCGCKIDTRKHKVCPHCGAAFDKDEEWVVRHAAEEEFIEKGTQKMIEAREKKAKEESAKILSRIRKTIAVICGLLVVIIALAGFGAYMSYQSKFRKSEEVNKGSYHNDYVPADYQVVGDGVLYDDHDVKITLTGFYLDNSYHYEDEDYGYKGYVKVEFHIENNRKEPINITLSSNSYNGIASDSFSLYAYDAYRQGEYTIYEEISGVPQQQINEIVFDRIDIRGLDYEFKDSLSLPVTVKTTSTYEQPLDYSDGTLIFTNDYIDIYATHEDPDEYEEDRDTYYTYIVNKTDMGFQLNGRDLKVDGEYDVIYGFYDQYLPGNYVFVNDYRAGYGSEAYRPLTKHKVETSISFKCPEDPARDFNTGYIEIKTE